MSSGGQVSSAVKTTVLGGLDVAATLACLCLHGTQFTFDNFALQFGNFSMFSSTIDLLLLTILRIALISLGCSILLLKKHPLVTLQRLSHVSFSIAILICAYSPTKLLLLAEKKDYLFIGDWLGLVENFIFAILAHNLWRSFVRVAKTWADEETAGHQIVSDDDESVIEDTQVRPQETFEVIVRLLQYCKREWIWHVSGFTWLFVYSISK